MFLLNCLTSAPFIEYYSIVKFSELGKFNLKITAKCTNANMSKSIPAFGEARNRVNALRMVHALFGEYPGCEPLQLA